MREDQTVRIGIRVLPFGALLSSVEDNIIVADAGDIQIIMSDGSDDTESYVTVNPETALKVAENLIIAAEQGMALVKEYEDQVK